MKQKQSSFPRQIADWQGVCLGGCVIKGERRHRTNKKIQKRPQGRNKKQRVKAKGPQSVKGMRVQESTRPRPGQARTANGNANCSKLVVRRKRGWSMNVFEVEKVEMEQLGLSRFCGPAVLRFHGVIRASSM